MLTDRSFVLTVDTDPDALVPLRRELAERLPATHGGDEEALLIATLLVRQAQRWRGGRGPVRLRSSILGSMVHFEVLRDVEEVEEAGPDCPEAFVALLDVLARCTERFTVSTFPGTVGLAAQKLVAPLTREAEIDLRTVA
jgi:hypothetical protein